MVFYFFNAHQGAELGWRSNVKWNRKIRQCWWVFSILYKRPATWINLKFISSCVNLPSKCCCEAGQSSVLVERTMHYRVCACITLSDRHFPDAMLPEGSLGCSPAIPTWIPCETLERPPNNRWVYSNQKAAAFCCNGSVKSCLSV